MVRGEREALNCGSVTSSLRVISDNDNCTRYSCRGTSICPDNRADTGHRPRGEESSPPPSPPPSLLRAGKRCIRRDIKSNIKYPPSARLISRLILSRTKKKLRSTQEILSFVPISDVFYSRRELYTYSWEFPGLPRNTGTGKGN